MIYHNSLQITINNNLLLNLLRDVDDLPLHGAQPVLDAEPGQVLPRHHAHHLVVVVQNQQMP